PRARSTGSCARMSNVLEHTKQQEIGALGRLGWTLSRTQETTGVNRPTFRLDDSHEPPSDIPGTIRTRPEYKRTLPFASRPKWYDNFTQRRSPNRPCANPT